MAGRGQSIETERAASVADERLAELMGVINAAIAELVAVIQDVIESDAWCGAGLRSPAHWVAWRAGVSPARAAALVQMARRLAELPSVAASFSEGRVSEDFGPPVLAAQALGVTPGSWTAPSGDPFDGRWFAWNQPGRNDSDSAATSPRSSIACAGP